MRNAITPSKETRSIGVVVVRSLACHLCDDAIEALEEIGATFPLDVSVVEIDSAPEEEAPADAGEDRLDGHAFYQMREREEHAKKLSAVGLTVLPMVVNPIRFAPSSTVRTADLLL